ncbi:MAG: Hint domain-containing protein [Pseudomonadota bacterium]
MNAGLNGTFVISWSQSEIDGLSDAPRDALRVGATWTWSGDLVRVDGPAGVLRLERAVGDDILRERAAKRARALVGAAVGIARPPIEIDPDMEDALPENGFLVTDGRACFAVSVVEGGRTPLLLFHDQLPPKETDLWVVRHNLDAQQDMSGTGMICFTSGTMIAAAEGRRAVETLQPGDLVQTKDNGLQEVQWVGSRRISAVRMMAMPGLRPIRIAASALGIDAPSPSLLVSSQHRVLVQGAAAQTLFNTPEVLVTAQDLMNGSTVRVEPSLRPVTYHHILLAQHNVIWANGLETESFHPASASLPLLASKDREALLDLHPYLERDPHSYGASVRRLLSNADAALLRYAA